MRYTSIIFLIFLSFTSLSSQGIPNDRVLSIDELGSRLKPEVKALVSEEGGVSSSRMAHYFKQAFSDRYFYDHNSFDARFEHYTTLYDNLDNHKTKAIDHLTKYSDSTQWVLPFNYKNGKPVNAYALRHLARQHKMVDIALYYFSDKENVKLIDYFENQMRSLNAALVAGEYEKIEDGNGVYEVFRSGYRVLNWLWIHNMFLNEPSYSEEDQLMTIATLLQHGADLYERNDKFRSGNHQTRGMSALAMLSILLRDFEGTELWYERAMLRLGEHLDKEINNDGFQFERSVHYHMSDINNYFYVYQLAKISKIDVDSTWEKKLRILFSTLVKIAYPDGSAPVLQDDTEIPWAEKNDISGVMTLGYLLFEDPEFGYFASNKVDEGIYWFLQDKQLKMLENIRKKKPSYKSLMFEDTHYYIMREGWNPKDNMMIISAGLDEKKPDHQHGDMLGLQAMANGKVILPNYQVRYSLKDFELFKNSMVKNVALVDEELQGKKWTSNKGGSGFGKFKQLPKPEVIAWQSNSNFDLFVGKHDGFDGVEYSRQVIYVKHDMWIVKDNFKSDMVHDYKQVWQGHYTQEKGPNLLRSSFDDANGCDILQLNPVSVATTSGTRGKNWTVVAQNNERNYNFVTVIYPYRKYNKRINEKSLGKVGSWKINNDDWQFKGMGQTSISQSTEGYFFNVNEVKKGDVTINSSQLVDLFIKVKNDKIHLHLLSENESTIILRQGKVEKEIKVLSPGEKISITLD